MAKQPILSKTSTRQSGQPWQRLQQAWTRQGNTLELLLPAGWPENPGMIHWRLRGAQGVAPHGQVMTLEQIPGVGATTRVHVWTPPSETLLTRVTLPTRSRAKIQQALPFALEDQLIGEPNQLHFAYRILEDNSLAVAVTARERLQAWIARLTEAGLRPASLCPAELALPLLDNSWSVTFQGNEIWVRTGIASGFLFPDSERAAPAMLVAALREANENQTAPRSLTVFQPPAGFDPKSWTTQTGLPIQTQTQDFWATHHEPTSALNLLQGSYAPSSQMRALVPALRPAAIMLAIWIVGSTGFNLWEWRQLKVTHENLQQEMTSLFRRTFPEAQVVVDPVLQMQRLVGDLQGKNGKSSGADLLPLLGSIAPLMQENSRLKLRSLQYGDVGLTLEITLPDFQTLETVKSSLTAHGVRVEVLSANSTAAGIEGRLRLSQIKRVST
jgi:general secretion pathway protein L